MTARPYDLVLFGATGFTGKLVADHIQKRAPDDFRWALAGRNPEKLRAEKEELSSTHAGQSVAIEVVDAQDQPGLHDLASRARVVCTTVGPYWWYGKKLAAACAQQGTHYCDLTGETPYIRHVIDAHQGEAEQSGARIVHCCGFDSIPSDIGTRVLQEHCKERFGAPATTVRTYVHRMKGGVSGGTAQSLIAIMEAVKDRAVRRAAGDPYGLCPDGVRGPDGSDRFDVRYDKTVDGWVGPFVMATVNTRVVRRTNMLLDYAYGEQFSYDEAHRFGRSMKGRLTGHMLQLGLGALGATAASGLGRKFLARFVLPKSGEGPDAASREAGFFELHIHGTTDAGERAKVVVRGEKDPGYGETATMLGETALCLALDTAVLDAAADQGQLVRAGVLTPGSAMGTVLADRLRAAGMTFRVDEAV